MIFSSSFKSNFIVIKYHDAFCDIKMYNVIYVSFKITIFLKRFNF